MTIALTCIGFLAGLLGGMLGIGGSLIMIPAMTEVLGPDQHLYQAAAMIVNVFVALPAVYQHRRAGAINASTVKKLMPITIAAVILGVLISEAPFFAGSGGEPYLRALFGIFLFVMVAYDLFRVYRAIRNRSDRSPLKASEQEALTKEGIPLSWPRAAGVAAPTGLIAGIMGVGGGAVAVPLQRRFLQLPVRTAIANSAAIIVGTAAVGATVKNLAYARSYVNWQQSILLASLLIPTAILGSLIGSRLTHRLPVRTVKTAFLCLMLIIAIRLTRQAYHDIAELRGDRGADTVAARVSLPASRN
ncbi:MAG: sulfite exporter TauE/SafE family protein [Planctomycetota bacterium]|jgi:uncharacterized membrane protein YfcA